MVRGKTPLDRAQVARVARAMSDRGQAVFELFPKGSGGGVSEASEKIWQDAPGFRKGIDEMNRAAEGLRQAAANGEPEAIESAYRALGRACSGCHKSFRVKKRK